MATKGMGRTIGAANVKIMPDTKGFSQKLKDNLQRIEKRAKLLVAAEINAEALRISAVRAIAQIERVFQLEVSANIQIDTLVESTRKAVESAEKTAGAITVDAGVDQPQLAAATRRAIESAKTAADKIIVPMDVDLSDLDTNGVIESAKRAVVVAEKAAGTITIGMDAGGDTEKLAQAARRAKEVAEKAVPPIEPGFDVDSPGLVARVRAAIAAAAHHAKISVDLDVKDGLSRFGSGLSAIIGPVGAVSAGLGKISAVAGGATAGIAGLAAHVASLVQALGPGTVQVGALAAAMGPAGLGGAALGIGTLKTAFSGLNDVLKAKNIEELGPALENLSPSAQSFAHELLSLKETFGDLQKDIQEKFFANFSNFGEIANLMGPLQEVMGDIAVDFGNAAAGAVDFLTQGTGFEAFNVLLENSGNIAGRLGDTLGSLFQGIVAAGAAASPIVSALSEKISEMAEAWAQKMVAGFQDGSLTEYFEHALETLKSFWGFVQDLGGIVSGVFSAMAASGGPLLGMLGAGADALNTWVHSAEGMATLTNFFSTMAGAVNAVLPIIGQLGGIVLTTLAPAFAQTVETLAPFVQILLESLKPALESLAPVLPVVAQAIGEGITALAPLLPVVAQAIGDILLAVAPLIPQLAQLATEILIPMIPTIATMIEGFAKIIEILIPLAPAIMGVVTAFVILANPVGAVIAAVGLLVGALVKYWPEISGFFDNLGQSISDGFSKFGDWLGGVGDTIVTGFNNATSTASAAVDELGQSISDGFSKFGDWLGGVGDTIVTGFNNATSTASAAVSSLWDSTTTAFQIGGESITSFTSSAWESIKYHFEQGVSIGLNTVSGFAATLKETFSRIGETLTTTFANAWADLQTAASRGVGGVIEWVASLPRRALDALGNIRDILFDSGVALIRGFIDGIRQMIHNVQNAAAEIVGAARAYFPFSPAKKGPFSGRGWVLYSGQAIGEAFAKGISDTAGRVATAARGVVADARDAFDEVSAAFAGGDWGYGTLEKHFGEGISRAIVGGAASAGNALRGWQTQTGGNLQAAGRAMGNTVGDAMAQGITRDKRPFIQREIDELLYEIGMRFYGHDGGYATWAKYLGDDLAKGVVNAFGHAGKVLRAEYGRDAGVIGVEELASRMMQKAFNFNLAGMNADIEERIRIFTTWSAQKMVDEFIYETESAWLGSDGGGVILNAIFGPQMSDQIFWGLRYWGERIRPALDDIKDAFDEVQTAFAGGDWGYGTLEKYLGTKSAQVLTKFVADTGDTFRQVTNLINTFRTDAIDAYSEVQTAFAGGDWGYGTLEKYLGTYASQALTDFAARSGETFREVTRQVNEFSEQINTEARQQVQKVNNIVQDQVQAVNRVTSPYVNEFNRNVDTMRYQAARAVSPMVNSGRAIGNAFAQGITDSRRQIENAASNATNAARAYFPFSPAKKGPFSGRGWVLYSGQAVGTAFAQGIADTTADAAAAAGKLAAATHHNLGQVSSSANDRTKPGAPGSGVGGVDRSIHVGTIVAADPDKPVKDLEELQLLARMRGGDE